MFPQDLQFDFQNQEFNLSDYAPTVVEISSPSDSGDYIATVQTQNKKLMEFFDGSDFSSPVKTIVSENIGNIDQFFADIKIEKLDDLNGLKQYKIKITRTK